MYKCQDCGFTVKPEDEYRWTGVHLCTEQPKKENENRKGKEERRV